MANVRRNHYALVAFVVSLGTLGIGILRPKGLKNPRAYWCGECPTMQLRVYRRLCRRIWSGIEYGLSLTKPLISALGSIFI
ncbi:hypothetical protein MiSe_45350 [Microseira wollei NIES-4236]|uniref:Uncharacterized protein n=1 Tax=Microseira wollei NIES-4236 TaxID=2530354 RepID=A0AAV3XE78_9CYAN|nr:hypothetical protein MiSe_45350 [Microseira wollei NIES-4236]